MKTTFLSAMTIVILGSLVGVGVNAVRGRDSINLGRNYFWIAGGVVETPTPLEGNESADNAPKHPFTSATLGEMIDWLESQEYATGQVVFVDAREDEPYEAGHIPGAFQIRNFHFDPDFSLFRDDVEEADVVIVYCGGGQCEDSIFVASALEGIGIPRSKLRVFEGGITAWVEEGLPVDMERE